MANPVSSFIASPDQVIYLHIMLGGTETGVFKGIPVIATEHYVKADAANVIGYSITFDISEMKKAAAENIGVDISAVSVVYQDGELTLMASGGGGGNT